MIDAVLTAFSTVRMTNRWAHQSWFKVAFLLPALAIIFAGCGQPNRMESVSTDAPSSGMEFGPHDGEDANEADGGDSDAAGSGIELPAPVDRKIIYNSTVQLVLKKTSLEEFETDIEALIKKHKAYKSNGTFKRNQGENRSGMWEIRVPADQYADFLTAVKKLGVPEEVQENTKDVTAQYVDLEARIANQKRLEERILGVLDEVKGKINDVLQVEKELARVRETIERLEGQMRVLKDKVTMATLTVHVREDKDYVPPQALSFGDSIGDIWGKSIDALMAFAKGVVLVVVAIFPWLLVILPPLYIFYRLVRRWIAKRFASNTPPVLAEGDESA